jgi:2,3-bisphosphoglycerate-independent phosphoglycerate mutase
MKAELITDDAIAAIKSGKYDFIKLNLPNPDMVGHTADFDAVVNACKCVDECLGKLISACKADNVNLVICADHGNAETMRYPDGKPYSAHTNTPVPFIVISPNKKFRLSNGTFGLTNIASTICLLLDVPADKAFNPSIIEEIKRHA